MSDIRVDGQRSRRRIAPAACPGGTGEAATQHTVRVVRCGDIWEVHIDGVVVSWAGDRAAAELEAARYTRPTLGRSGLRGI